jgi:hypothetical protein
MRHLASALLALVLLAGCDASLDTATPLADVPGPARAVVTSDSAYARLLRDVGGLEGLARLRREASNETLAATFARHGIAFEVIDREAAEAEAEALGKLQDITACPQLFPTEDRGKWFRLIGAGGAEDHYIDTRGRPLTSFKSLGPIVTAARQTTCQANVGNWGAAGDTYDGGHMIGSQLGGWGGRANLVPQQYNFNRGNWVKIENALAKCGRLGNGAVEWHVDVDYPNTTTLTPSAFHADIKIAGVWKSGSFTNTAYGGPNGTTTANSIVTWLQGKGCY